MSGGADPEGYTARVRAGMLAGTRPCPRCTHPVMLRQLAGDDGPGLYDVTVAGVAVKGDVAGVHSTLTPHGRDRCRRLRGAGRIPSWRDLVRIVTLVLMVLAAGLAVTTVAADVLLPLMGMCT